MLDKISSQERNPFKVEFYEIAKAQNKRDSIVSINNSCCL